MDNKVTHVARALDDGVRRAGVPLQFPRRGGERGNFDNGRGETDDLAAVVAEGRRRFPGAALWLGGFSFGAFVALRGAQSSRPTNSSRWRRRWRASSSAAWRIRTATGCWRKAMRTTWCPPKRCSRGPRSSARKPRLHVLAGAGHFFHGKLHELKPLVMDFLRA